jgi:uncharacterized protein (TIGR03435 family)
VEVRQGANLKRLQPGDQVGTAPVMESLPVAEEISWSRYWQAYLTALEKAGALAARREFKETTIQSQPGPVNGASAGFACHGIDGVWRSPLGSPAEPTVVPLGECVGSHVTPSILISAAYDVKDIEGGPDWLYGRNSANLGFQIEAQAQDPSTATTKHLKEMLQTLLGGRFRLKFHRGNKEVHGFALAVGANEPKLTATQAAEEEPIAIAEGGRLTIHGKSSMKKLADFLPRRFPNLGVVLDQTGLNGTYDYTLRLPSSESSISEALQRQLGLQLEPRQVPVEIVVVDEIRKPPEQQTQQ